MPGKIFSYDTTATMLLCIIIARVSGMEFTQLLRDRLFIPAGMSEDISCIETPCGHEWGGSGLLATPRDLAKFAYCCMHGGRIAGQQLLPEDYIRAATARQIDNTLTAETAEHTFGYGYQFWRTRHNGFACRGMGSQLAVCLPDHDFILVTTGDTQGIPSACECIYDALWTEIFPYLEKPAAVAEDAGACAALCAKWADREIVTVKGEKTSPVMQTINKKTFVFDQPNEVNFKWARFTFEGDEGLLEYENADGPQSLRFGLGHQTEGKLSQTRYFGKRIGVPKGEGYACTASGAWVTENDLYIVCYAIDDYVGNFGMSFVFEDGCITCHGRNYAEWFFDEFWGFASGREEKA